MKKNKIIYVLLSAAVSILLIWFLMSQIETEDLAWTFSRIYLPALSAYMAIALFGAFLRAWRFKWLLQPEPITWGNILLVTFIKNSLIDLLPARIGSLSYIYILNRRLNITFETATSTFVLAFVFDFLTLSPFLIAAVFVVGLGATSISTPLLLLISLLFFLLVLLFLWKIIPLSRILLRIFRQFLKLIRAEEKKAARLSVEKLDATIQSLSDIRARKIYLPIFLLSLCIRLVKYVSIFSLFFALLRSHGFGLRDLSIWKMILGISGAELTSALPIKGLAGFGTWESAWALTFRLMNFDPRLAIISGIGVHLLTNVFEYTLGLLSIFILLFPFLKNARTRKKK